MSLPTGFSFAGKRALVVGGATGMGAAAAEIIRDAGAETIVLDRAEVTLDGVQTGQVDLADRASIDAVVESITGPIDALLSCAGVADGTPGLERINFIGHRHLIDGLVAKGALGRGSAIGMISSAAGLGWERNVEELKQYLDVADFDAATAWAQEHQHTDYMWSKQALCLYVARESFRLLKQGIRINAICPGPTDTPLAQANKELWLSTGAGYRAEAAVEASTPLEQAYPLVFLCSAAAAAITGQTIVSDAGWIASGVTGSFPADTGFVNFLLGRY